MLFTFSASSGPHADCLSLAVKLFLDSSGVFILFSHVISPLFEAHIPQFTQSCFDSSSEVLLFLLPRVFLDKELLALALALPLPFGRACAFAFAIGDKANAFDKECPPQKIVRKNATLLIQTLSLLKETRRLAETYLEISS